MVEEIKVAVRLAGHGIRGYRDSAIASGETNDCFVIAVAAAVDCDYDTAHSYVESTFKRKARKGTHGVLPGLRKNGEILGREIEELGETIDPSGTFPGKRLVVRYKNYGGIVERRMTFKSFVRNYSKGTYVLIVKSHAFCLRDGVVVGGNIQDAQALRKRINSAFKVK